MLTRTGQFFPVLEKLGAWPRESELQLIDAEGKRRDPSETVGRQQPAPEDWSVPADYSACAADRELTIGKKSRRAARQTETKKRRIISAKSVAEIVLDIANLSSYFICRLFNIFSKVGRNRVKSFSGEMKIR
jgi:hypothetical protein